MTDYRLYVFDLDGTLLNTLGDLAASVNHALQWAGMPGRTVEEVRMMVGNGVEILIRRAVADGSSEEQVQEVLGEFRRYYVLHGEDTTQPYPGIMELLAELRRRGRGVAVVSNKFDKATKALCARFFPGLVDVAIGENEAVGIRKKPAPDSVQAIMAQAGCSPQECVYIGDSDVDIDTARNAGIDCVSVLWGFRDEAFLLGHGAQRIIATPGELLA